MAKLYFKYGAMGSSKSAQALITKFNYEEQGMTVWLIKPSIDTRDGAELIRSRIGLSCKAEIITPERYVKDEFEGFGEMAKLYYDFLKQHEDEMKILKYGYRLKQEAFSEQIVTDSMESVAERVVRGVKEENRPFDAVIQGVDDPWDVCLMQFFWLHTKASVAHNMEDFKNAGMFK